MAPLGLVWIANGHSYLLDGSLRYVLHPLLASSNPSNRRCALAPASVSKRCGCPFSTVYRATVPLERRNSASRCISPCHMYSSNSPTYMNTHMFEIFCSLTVVGS